MRKERSDIINKYFAESMMPFKLIGDVVKTYFPHFFFSSFVRCTGGKWRRVHVCVCMCVSFRYAMLFHTKYECGQSHLHVSQNDNTHTRTHTSTRRKNQCICTNRIIYLIVMCRRWFHLAGIHSLWWKQICMSCHRQYSKFWWVSDCKAIIIICSKMYSFYYWI